MIKSLIVIDDFLDKPEIMREAALSQEYPARDTPTTYPGRDSAKRVMFKGFDERVAEVVGERLVPAAGISNGYFRLALDGDKGTAGVHIDISQWTAILYLSLPDDCPDSVAAGTHLFRHKATNSDHAPYDEQELAAMGFATPKEFMDNVVTADTNDPGKWEKTMTIPLRYNRLMLFRPQQYHDAGAGFGSDLSSGRLVYLNFYNNVDARRI